MKKDRYEMHKYWGKKPSKDLKTLIEQYSNENDILFDPFAGYGVFCIEAYVTNRKVVLNDLNPIASFIQKNVLERNVSIDKLKIEWNIIKDDVGSYINNWFSFRNDGENKIITSVLRTNNDDIVRCKYKNNTKMNPEYKFTSSEIIDFKILENDFHVATWYPTDTMLENSRITVKPGTKIEKLFTKRTLDCHSVLFESINRNSSGAELNLFLLTFTANLANCSRLVPPIKSRGEMAPGAWMTGFYTGATYLENNVIHYFENRLNKVIKGKQEYLNEFDNLFNSIDDSKLGKRKNFDELVTAPYPGYLVKTDDIKSIDLPDKCIDYIFTDPPYGDSVPYFEQSIIWNSWLKSSVDYKNEIIISNSKARDKNSTNYMIDMKKAISEIYRVLKPEKYFSITFHSLSGLEWNALNNACIEIGFTLHDFQWLVQKTFTPRQLNRAKSVKGDILITFKKSRALPPIKYLEKETLKSTIVIWITNIISKSPQQTNDIFLRIVKQIYEERIIINGINFFEILSGLAKHENGKWSL